MATPEANITSTTRGVTDVNGNHTTHPNSARNLQNFNTFQFVSQLVSATPPYLFNMSTPFPGNFFSDLLRRMAPRAGTPGLSMDSNLQQHIRAALMTKGTPPPNLPPSLMHSQLDLAALASPRQQSSLSSNNHEKGNKRSLFTDINALSSCDNEPRSKRVRLDEDRDERRDHVPESIPAPFLMQPPFLPNALNAHPDILSPWTSRSPLLRPQIPLPSPVPQNSLDPYRLLLDLRLAGQLRSMATSHILHNKDQPLGGYPPLATANNVSNEIRATKESKNNKTESSSSNTISGIRGDDSRVSAFHPPGKNNEATGETSEDEVADRRSNSRNSTNSSGSNGNKDVLGPQYIFKNLNEIYQSINTQQGSNSEADNSESANEDKNDHFKKETKEALNEIHSPAQNLQIQDTKDFKKTLVNENTDEKPNIRDENIKDEIKQTKKEIFDNEV